MLVLGLILTMVAWLVYRGTGHRPWVLVSWAGLAIYALGAIWLAFSFGILYVSGGDRSTKFIRAAYSWLVLACLMMIVEPLYLWATELHFSHAFRGAIRHAFTVGFISLMIVGVSSKVVPILKGIDVHGLPSLWIPFILINFGNCLRIGSQVATDLTYTAFPVMGVSGFFEVAGFAIWGIHLWRLMRKEGQVHSTTASKPAAIEPAMKVAEVVDWYPELLEVFVRYGFKELQNPILRNTIARAVTIDMACKMKNIETPKFIEELNKIVGK
jgi:hypothetical protein